MDTIIAITNQWNDTAPEAQVNFLTACVKKAAKNEIAYSVEDNYNGYNELVLWANKHLDELVNEAYCKLAENLKPELLANRNAKRTAEGKAPVTLAALVYGAARNAIMSQYRQEVKHARAALRTTLNDEGQEINYYDMVAAPRSYDTEAEAFANIALERVLNSRDEVDRIIASSRRYGYSEREIAGRVGMSGPAVHKRIEKVRIAFEPYI